MKRIIREKDLRDEYTAATLAPYLDVSERQIHYYRKNGLLECENRGRARFVFPKESLINFMVKQWGYEYEK